MPGNRLWQEVEDFCVRHQCGWSRDPVADDAQWGIHLNDDPPHNRLLGPVFSRGSVTGVVYRHGREVFAFGEPDRPDMTFSVTKTYLAMVAGVAFDRGLLTDLARPVCQVLPGVGFDDEHNCQITWLHLLPFTSEWNGTCFGVPDTVDRYRRVGMQPAVEAADVLAPRKGDPRPLKAPGSYWEYNDVRINQFSLALLYRVRQSLPDLFDACFSSALSLSGTHHWYGYENSYVIVDGQRVQSVPGGGHWGGGMRISARDQAKIGCLLLNNGRVDGQQLLSTEWINLMTSACDIAPFYGYFTWLNTGRKIVPAASEKSFFAFGVGGQVVWHDPASSTVAVFRWIDTDHLNELVAMVSEVAT